MGNRQKLKEEAVKALEKDVQNLDANDLEYVANHLIELLEGVKIVHRGLNKDGKPVRSTVDSFTSERTLIGEYSTEAGYFEKPFKKLLHDTQHARSESRNLKKVYLFSTCECAGSAWPKVTKAVSKKLGPNISFEIYDSRELAKTIYEQVLEKNNSVEYLSDFLPHLQKLWTENAVSNAVPEFPKDFCDDPRRTELIESALAKQQMVAVVGISGTGKTYAAISYAQKCAGEFRNTIWMHGEDLAGATDLKAVKIARLGVDLNVATQLCTSPCLLIVDDWRGATVLLTDLVPKGVHPQTRVLITCIHHPGPGVFCVSLPELSDDVAAQVLEFQMIRKPTAGERAEICKRTASHPLTLAIIRDTVRELGLEWQQITDDLANIVDYAGPDHETILQRILVKHSHGIANELRKLKWLDSKVVDSAFALDMLQISGLTKVLRRSLLRKDAHGLCRMHDLVFACLRRFEGGDVREQEIESTFWRFLKSNWRTGAYHFQRTLQLHASKITSKVGLTSPKPSFESYLLLLIEAAPKSPELLEALRSAELKAHVGHDYAYLAIIEAIERKYQSSCNSNNKSEILKQGIANIDTALQSKMPDDIRQDLLHHRGKLFLWYDKAESAIRDFETVLAGNSNAYQSHLQLARAKARLRDATCSKHVEKIFEAFKEDTAAVSITLVLAAFTELEKHINSKLREKWLISDSGLFETAVSLAAAEGFSQPYRTLGRLGRFIFYNQPGVLVRLAELVSFPQPSTADVEECFEIAEALKSIGKACVEHYSDSFAEQKWYELALEFYSKVPAPDEYKDTMHAECLLRLKRCGEAFDLLDRSTSTVHLANWWQRRAQALLGLSKPDEALDSINEALRVMADKKYLSALLQVKAQAELAKGMPSAIQTLEEAARQTENAKYRAALESELKAVKMQFSSGSNHASPN